MMTRYRPYKRPICPACGAIADYDRDLDRYIHRDPQLSNIQCWAEISSGRTDYRGPSDDILFILYRMFNAKDELLYVGITYNPGMRFERHARDSEWFPEVALILLEHHNDVASLRNAETQAITTELPRYNVVHGTYKNKRTRDEERYSDANCARVREKLNRLLSDDPIRTPQQVRSATNSGEVDTVHQQDIRWRRGR